MFQQLGDKLTRVFKNLRGQGTLSESNVKEALRDVRMALLEADVNFKVAKDFMDRVKDKALGQEVLTSVQPGQQFIKVVHDELIEMMGGEPASFELKPGLGGRPPIIMLLGLQGSGKTTLAGKLSARLLKQKFKPLLVACDIYRPAAIHQLEVVGRTVGVPVYQEGQIDPVQISTNALAMAAREGRDAMIVDTAGRLHIDEVKMDELVALKAFLKPDFCLLVADSMTGQDAVNSADAFNKAVGIDGVALTKMDGDARGGAALSIKAVTGKPIIFMSTGEKPEDLEMFRPQGVVSRLLGMGDVVELVERAQEMYDEKEAEALHKKMRKQTFSLTDFLTQLQRLKKMGSFTKLLGLIPGLSQLKGIDISDKDFARIESMILSMTYKERDYPDVLDASRRRRVAKGSGTSVEEVNGLLRQFDQMKKMMAHMAGMVGPGGAMPAGAGPGDMPVDEMGVPSGFSRQANAMLTGRRTMNDKDFKKKKAADKAKKQQRKRNR